MDRYFTAAPVSGASPDRLEDDICRLVHSLGSQRIEAVDKLLGPGWQLRHAVLGMLPIETSSDGFFDFAEAGSDALIIPAYWGPEPSFEHPCFDDEPPPIIDLVAFYPSNLDRWWRRTGIADFLGEHRLRAANTWGKALWVYKNPLRYLLAPKPGVCPVSRSIERLRDAPGLRFERGEELFAKQLGCRLSQPLPVPRIEVAA